MQFYILFNLTLVIASCFLTWIEPKIFVVALRGIQMIDGKIVLILGLIGFISICYELLRRKAALFWVYGFVGFIISIIVGMEFFSFYQNDYSGGPGLYLAALSGVQLTGTYVVYLFHHEKNGDISS